MICSNDRVEVPNLPETFWGPEENKHASEEIRSFVIEVPTSVSEKKKTELKNMYIMFLSRENIYHTCFCRVFSYVTHRYSARIIQRYDISVTRHDMIS